MTDEEFIEIWDRWDLYPGFDVASHARADAMKEYCTERDITDHIFTRFAGELARLRRLGLTKDQVLNRMRMWK